MSDKNTHWGIYCRRSRDRDDEKTPAIEVQKDMCLRYAGDHQMLVDEVYAEVVSGRGSFDERSELMRLLVDAKNGKIGGVLCYDGYRLSRDTTVTALVIGTLKEAGVRLHYIDGGEQDLQSELGEVFVYLQGLFASVEYTKIRQRFKTGMQNSVRRGEYIWTRAPYGYKKVVKNGCKTLEVIPSEADMVRKIFQWKSEGVSIREIVRRLSSSGYQTHYGGKWDAKTISCMLKNPVYIGKVRQGSTKIIVDTAESDIFKKSTKKRRVYTPESVEVVDGLHEGIVDEDLFYMVQGLISSQPRAKYPHLSENKLAGLLKCKICGYAYTLTGQNGHPEYKQYRHRYSDPRMDCSFADRSVNWRTVERSVIKKLREDIEDFEVHIDAESVVEDTQQKIQEKQQELEKLTGKERKKLIRRRNAEMDRLEDLKEDEASPFEIDTQQEIVQDYEDRLKDLQCRVEHTQKELEELRKKDVAGQVERSKMMKTTLSSALDLIEADAVDAGVVNTFLRTFIDKILIDITNFKKYDEFVDVEIVYK